MPQSRLAWAICQQESVRCTYVCLGHSPRWYFIMFAIILFNDMVDKLIAYYLLNWFRKRKSAHLWVKLERETTKEKKAANTLTFESISSVVFKSKWAQWRRNAISFTDFSLPLCLSCTFFATYTSIFLFFFSYRWHQITSILGRLRVIGLFATVCFANPFLSSSLKPHIFNSR